MVNFIFCIYIVTFQAKNLPSALYSRFVTGTALLDCSIVTSFCCLLIFIPPYGSMEVFSLLCVCLFVCHNVRLRISQRREKIGSWNFARMFDYYPQWASPVLGNVGSRGVTAAALLLVRDLCSSNLDGRTGLPARLRGDLELGAVTPWDSRNCVRFQNVKYETACTTVHRNGAYQGFHSKFTKIRHCKWKNSFFFKDPSPGA